MGVEILDLTKGVPPRATDRVPNRDADRERYQFLPPLRYHDPMVPQADHQPAQDLELKRSTAAEQLLRRLVVVPTDVVDRREPPCTVWG
jgi:hypothetical protein